MKILLMILAVWLAGCATSQTSKQAVCGNEGDASSLSIVERAEIRISLPQGSALKHENTVDARYWVWSTSIGDVSVTWIGKEGRETLVEAMAQNACTSDAGFLISVKSERVTAVSQPLLPNGASVVVEIQGADGRARRDVALAIARSVEIDVERMKREVSDAGQ